VNLLDRFFNRSPAVGTLTDVRAAIRQALRESRDLSYIEKGDSRAAIDEIARVTSPLQSQADYVAFGRALLEPGETFTNGRHDALVRHRELGLRPRKGDYCGMMLRAVLVGRLWPRIRDDLLKKASAAAAAVSGDEECVHVDPERGILPKNDNAAANGSLADVLLAAAKSSGTANGLAKLIEKNVDSPRTCGYYVPTRVALNLIHRARQAEKDLRRYAKG